VAAAGMMGAAAVVFLFDPAHNKFYPVCLFHQMTGLNCPGCGATRALHALMHGHIADAARFNLLFLLCLPYLGWIAARTGLGWLEEKRLNVAISSTAMWTFLVMSVVFGVLRNLPGFEWLSP
jgi:hypothetical protein